MEILLVRTVSYGSTCVLPSRMACSIDRFAEIMGHQSKGFRHENILLRSSSPHASWVRYMIT